MDEARYDDLLLTIAGQCGGIRPLLRTFFSFLKRRTDFYVVFEAGASASMGFPPGAAERMLLEEFRRNPMKPLEAEQQETRSLKKKQPRPAAAAAAAAGAAAGGEPLGQPRQGREAGGGEQRRPRAPPGPTEDGAGPPGVLDAEAKTGGATSAAVGAGRAAEGDGRDAAATAAQPKPPGVRYTDDGKQIPIGNGGIAEGYTWTQTLYETTVYIELPGSVTSRDVAATFQARSVNLRLKSGQVLLEGELDGTVRSDDCMWTLESSTMADAPSRTLVVTFDKAVQTWWRSVIKGHPEIDTTKVRARRGHRSAAATLSHVGRRLTAPRRWRSTMRRLRRRSARSCSSSA